jgi:hypothetical protein
LVVEKSSRDQWSHFESGTNNVECTPRPYSSPVRTCARPFPKLQSVAQTAARAAHAAEDEKLAETKTAALGIAQIRHAVANSNTLKLSRVRVMPTNTICYRLQLRNSRGVAYLRTAVMDGSALKTSGSDGFTALWGSRCTHQSGDRDITSDVENVIHLPTE